MAKSERRLLSARSLVHGISAEILEDRHTSEAIDAAFRVHEALGVAHDEATYRAALTVELVHRGLRVNRDATFSVLYRERVVGTFHADLLVEEKLLVQIKADASLTDAHRTDTIRGLAAGGVKLGLVFNFGLAELFFARIY